jgi:hypothetical protein
MESGELKGDALVTYDLSAGDSAFGLPRPSPRITPAAF